jgi:hypothetical protein
MVSIRNTNIKIILCSHDASNGHFGIIGVLSIRQLPICLPLTSPPDIINAHQAMPVGDGSTRKKSTTSCLEVVLKKEGAIKC